MAVMNTSWESIEQYILSHYRDNPSVLDYRGNETNESNVANYFVYSRLRFHLLAQQVMRYASPGARVLEVGVGYGTLVMYLQFAGYQVCACEVPENIPAYTASLQKKGISVIPWDIHKSDCPLPSRDFDVVIASEVLEHLQISLKSAICKLVRPLIQGGVLIITTPNLYRLPNIRSIIRGRNIIESFPDESVLRGGIVVDNRTHPREPTLSELIAGLRASGLKVIKTDFFNSEPLSLSRKIVYRICPKRFRHHLLVIGRR